MLCGARSLLFLISNLSHFRISQEFLRIFTSNHQFSRNIFAPTSTVIRFLLPSVTMIRNVFMAGLCAASVPMITAVRLEERKIAKYMLHEKLKKNFEEPEFCKIRRQNVKIASKRQFFLKIAQFASLGWPTPTLLQCPPPKFFCT